MYLTKDSRMAPKKMISDCAECVLSKDCIPSGISTDNLHRFVGIVSTNISYKAGDVLFEQKAKAQHLFVVKTGSFKTQTTTPHGIEHVNNFFLPGELIGLESASSGISCNTAIALEDGVACKINYQQLTKLRQEFPSLSDFAVKIYSAALALANEIQNNATIQCASSRLATFLVLYNRRCNAHGMQSLGLHLPMCREDIASHLGLAVETISRSFTKLITTGCIKKDGRRVQILNLEKLHDEANLPPRK
jgi:CRP/FNR family transcriptional regulator